MTRFLTSPLLLPEPGWSQLLWHDVSSSSVTVQKSSVMPQKPHGEQQLFLTYKYPELLNMVVDTYTFRGQVFPGGSEFLPHSALASQLLQQTSLGD